MLFSEDMLEQIELIVVEMFASILCSTSLENISKEKQKEIFSQSLNLFVFFCYLLYKSFVKQRLSNEKIQYETPVVEDQCSRNVQYIWLRPDYMFHINVCLHKHPEGNVP